MCRMTDIGVRGADAIDKEGLWYVSDRRVYGGPLYLFDLTGSQDMSAFSAKISHQGKTQSWCFCRTRKQSKVGLPISDAGTKWILKADGGADE